MSTELMDYGMTGSSYYTIDWDGVHFSGAHSYYSPDYITINPSIYTFYYDVVVSIDQGNWFLIGWERYDADKTARSNNACVYVINSHSTNSRMSSAYNDVIKQRFKGTVDLSTDGVNACKYIKLRVLNKWDSAETNGKATIHSLSLLAIPTGESIGKKAYRTGRMTGDCFREYYNNSVSMEKVGYIDSNILYEY